MSRPDRANGARFARSTAPRTKVSTMRTLLRGLLVTALALCALPLSAQAQPVPEMLPYNGFLADSNGQPVDGTVNLTVRIYETSDSPNPVWQETLQNLPVDAGSFRLDLGLIVPLVQDVQAGRTRYLGLSVNGDAEATPRQRIGAVPYALMAMNSAMLGGAPAELYVTVDRLNQELAGRGYVTEARVRELIAELGGGGGEGGLDAAAVNALIDARGYLTEVQINALIDGRGYLTEADVNALIDAREYLDADGVNALIDARGYVNQAQVEALVDARVAVAIDALRVELRNEIQQAAAAGTPYILGRSAQTSNGRFTFGGVNGIRAANAMCRATFADEATAHLCSYDEVGRALAADSYNADNNFSGQATWSASPVVAGNFNGTYRNTCQNFMYNSADAGTGVQLTARLNQQSDGNGGGVVGHTFEVLAGRACANNLPVLCCR